MAEIFFKGIQIQTNGSPPQTGDILPELWATGIDLQDVQVTNWKTDYCILNIVPSLDTGVCAASAREFDGLTANHFNLTVCTISRDTPFALARFQRNEDLRHTQLFSSLRDCSFGDTLGITILTGPLKGLLARTVFLLNRENEVLYTELVPDLSQEPDYTKIFDALESTRL